MIDAHNILKSIIAEDMHKKKSISMIEYNSDMLLLKLNNT